MNKSSVVLVGVFILFMTLPASAQLNVGVLGGLNVATLSVDPDDGLDISNRTGFGFGGVVDISLGEMLVLHLEPMFLQKGAEIDNVKVKASFIDVPVLIKYAFGSGQAKPYVMAGPNIGFLLSAKADDEDIDEVLKSLDFGVDFGAGVSFPMGNNSLFVEGRYALGLSNLNDDPDFPDGKIKTRGIQIFAGITFPLGAK
jgi:hypothetical protein